jgi:hypothetical protein
MQCNQTISEFLTLGHFPLSVSTLIIFSATTQLLGIPFLVWVKFQANNISPVPEMITNQETP